MKQYVIGFVMLVGLASCTSINVKLADKDLAEERRPLSGFQRVELLGSLDVRYTQADSFSVVVKAPADVIGEVETNVKDSCLVVGMRGEGAVVNFGIADSDDVTVYVTSPDFLGIELKGSGDFTCDRPLDTDNLDIRLKGSGDIRFRQVICDRAAVQLVGSGDVDVKLLTAQLSSVEVVGSGDVEMAQQQVAQTALELKGSGDIKINFRQCGAVKARLVGSGDITLRGDVATLESNTRGSGDIKTGALTVREQSAQ